MKDKNQAVSTKKSFIKPQTLKGFRDFLPEEMKIRQKAMEILRQVFESYGFQPLETPALEYAETLLGKSGEEAEKLMYLFKDHGGRDVGLRYELTVSLARVMTQYPNIPLPFKRYQMQPVWRAENIQKGRYREFWQCDVDIMGAASPLADAEIIELIYQSLNALGFKKFVIKINSRKILFKLLEDADIPFEKQTSTLISIDKLEKIGKEKVEEELAAKGFDEKAIRKIFGVIGKSRPDEVLGEIFRVLKIKNIPEEYCQFTPTMVRGLEYYTGPIFESFIFEPKIGSLSGGGRWDELIGKFTGKNMPATGTTIGLERIVDVIKELNFWPRLSPSQTMILVTIFSPELLEQSLRFCSIIRINGINAEIYPDEKASLDKQLKYADKKGIPYAAIIGPEEAKNDLVTVKKLATKEQKTVSQNELLEILRQA